MYFFVTKAIKSVTMENLVLISKEDLKGAFIEWASEANKANNDEYLTTPGLASYIGHSEEWVRQRSSRFQRGLTKDFPPFTKRGRKLLFKKSDVDAWLEAKP